jgi:hypothetical protein
VAGAVADLPQAVERVKAPVGRRPVPGDELAQGVNGFVVEVARFEIERGPKRAWPLGVWCDLPELLPGEATGYESHQRRQDVAPERVGILSGELARTLVLANLDPRPSNSPLRRSYKALDSSNE